MELLLNEAVYDLWVRATYFADDDLIGEAGIVDYVFDNRAKMYPCVAYLGRCRFLQNHSTFSLSTVNR